MPAFKYLSQICSLCWIYIACATTSVYLKEKHFDKFIKATLEIKCSFTKIEQDMPVATKKCENLFINVCPKNSLHFTEWLLLKN